MDTDLAIMMEIVTATTDLTRIQIAVLVLLIAIHTPAAPVRYLFIHFLSLILN